MLFLILGWVGLRSLDMPDVTNTYTYCHTDNNKNKMLEFIWFQIFSLLQPLSPLSLSRSKKYFLIHFLFSLLVQKLLTIKHNSHQKQSSGRKSLQLATSHTHTPTYIYLYVEPGSEPRRGLCNLPVQATTPTSPSLPPPSSHPSATK